MCGYYGRKAPDVFDQHQDYWQWITGDKFEPGGFYARRRTPGLVIQQDDEVASVPAIWWYLLKRESDGRLVPNLDVTTFNARDLSSRLWKPAVETRRGVVFASEIGERSAKGTQYLMTAEAPVVIACLYNRYQSDGDESPTYSFALITRDPHPRFEKYHEKSTPLFLPADADAVKHWLNPNVPSIDSLIQDLVGQARLPTPFTVTPVRSYKSADATGEPETLAADA